MFVILQTVGTYKVVGQTLGQFKEGTFYTDFSVGLIYLQSLSLANVLVHVRKYQVPTHIYILKPRSWRERDSL